MSTDAVRCATFASTRTRQRGLTLIEILVGVAVGIIGVLAIFQTVAVWTRHTQTSGAGGDAQIAGTIALFSIERDLKQAGNGFGEATTPVMGCAVQANSSASAAAIGPFALSPVEIVASDTAPDEIHVLAGDSSFFTAAGDYTFTSPTRLTLVRRGGFKAGDLAIVTSAPTAVPASANCALVEITDDTLPDGRSVDHLQTGNYTSFYSGGPAASRFNTGAETTAANFPAGKIFNLGPTPQRNRWRILNDATHNHTLVKEDLIAGTSSQIADNIVSIKAQYGIDTNGDRQISAAEWTAVAPADWTNVLAIRVAVLVRSQQFERSVSVETGASAGAVTPNPPTYAGGASFPMTNVDGGTDSFGPLDVDPNNWRYYRYRVYERVIPLRNVQWGAP